MNSSSINQDPSARQARVLEALDRQITALDEIETFADSGSNEAGDVYTIVTVLSHLGADKIRTGLEGRRNILQRHAPEASVLYPGIWYCKAHGSMCVWADCPDWRDASAGLEEN